MGVGALTVTHSRARTAIGSWLISREPRLYGLFSPSLRVGQSSIRIPDLALYELLPPDDDNDFFNEPPWLCVEITSPEDKMIAMLDRMDDYLKFGVPNIWIIDPEKHRGWRITQEGWLGANDRIMRTADGRIAMPLSDVLES
jgi:Uma2 family endonuclease